MFKLSKLIFVSVEQNIYNTNHKPIIINVVIIKARYDNSSLLFLRLSLYIIFGRNVISKNTVKIDTVNNIMNIDAKIKVIWKNRNYVINC